MVPTITKIVVTGRLNTRYPQKCNVCRIIGPSFFNGMLGDEQYLDFLRFELIPSLVVLFPNAEDSDSIDPRIPNRFGDLSKGRQNRQS